MIRSFSFFWFSALISALSLISCRTEFETVRVSGNTDLIYKKAFEYNENGDYLKAQTLFELLIPAYRGKKELEQIYFTYAYTYYYEKKYLLSSYYFDNFATTFSASPLREEAEFMSAYSHYEMSPIFRLDQTYTKKAIDEFQLFINTFPESKRVPDANKLIDELRLKMEQKVFAEGELYFNLNQYQAAILTFENMLKDFPETRQAELVRFLIVKASFLLAENSVITKQEERYQIVAKKASEFLSKYKSSTNSAEVRSMNEKSLIKIKSFENERYQNQSTRTGS